MPSKSEDSSFSRSPSRHCENALSLSDVSNLVLQGPGKGEVACAAVSVSLEAGRTFVHCVVQLSLHIAAGV